MINIAIYFATYSSLLCLLASSFVWLWGIKRPIRHRCVTLFVSCRHSYTPVSANEINNVTTKNLYFPTLFRPQSSLLRLLASSFVWLWGIKRLIRHTLVTLFVSCRHSYTPVSANEINNVTTKNLYFPTLFRPQSSLLRLLASSFVWLWGIKRLIRHTLVTLFVSCPHTYPRFSANEINDVTTKNLYVPLYFAPSRRSCVCWRRRSSGCGVPNAQFVTRSSLLHASFRHSSR